MNDTTKSGATGNAAAQVNAGTAPDAVPWKRKDILTDAELALHLIYNQHILEAQEKLDQLQANEDYFGSYTDDPEASLLASGAISANVLDRAIYERAIEQELIKVQTEYADLAKALDDGREDYLAAGSVPQGLKDWNSNDFVGTEHSTAQIHAAQTAANYERTLAQYRAIELGFAHHTTREIAEGVGLFLVETAVIEVATLGAGTLLSGARLAERSVAAIRSVTWVQHLLLRYERISAKSRAAARAIYEKVIRRRKPVEAPKGPAAGKPPKGQNTRPCAACAFGGNAQ